MIVSIQDDSNYNKKLNFPKLMISSDELIVLMTGACEGVVISNKARVRQYMVSEYYVGQYINDWNMDSFKDYNGTVTLENLKN
jgi:hypothetical protein